MDRTPTRRSKKASKPQQPSFDKTGQSQTTIDLYLKPVAKVKKGQNDIRNYFSPVTKKHAIPDSLPSSPERTYNDNSAANCQTPGPSPSLKPPAQGSMCIPESQQSDKKVPSIFSGVRNHKHVNSAVLPRFDPFFDNEDFPHSTSPMAPRTTDVVRYSLVPKPLNIKMPPPPAETSRSPSQTTSSPSSVGDFDTLSLDGEEIREAPSFKQTYRTVHSRQNTNDSPISPLTALRDPSPQSWRQGVGRPATLRSKTMPQLSEPNSNESVIYFLPKISPTSDSSADEREPLINSSHRMPLDKSSIRAAWKGKKQAMKLEDAGPVYAERRVDALKERTVTVSPGAK